MEFAIQMNVLDHLAPVRLECRAKIMQSDAAELSHQPIRRTAWQSPRKQRVFAFQTPAADDVVTLVQLGNKNRNFFRVVLKISVHRNDHFAASKVEARFEA